MEPNKLELKLSDAKSRLSFIEDELESCGANKLLYMKVIIEKKISEIEMKLENKSIKYLVGLCIGGLMECPQVEVIDIEVISATSEKEAEDIYNKKHNCSFYHAHCLGVYSNGIIPKKVAL